MGRGEKCRRVTAGDSGNEHACRDVRCQRGFARADSPPASQYLERKARDGVYGNNIEIQAISELFNRPIYIFTPTSSTPINTFHSDYTDPPLYVVYYAASEHYDALLNHARPSIGLGLGLPGMKVGGGEESIMKEVGGKSDVAHSEEIMRKKVSGMCAHWFLASV